MGSGQFGIVYCGLLTVSGVDCEGGVKEVAVKTMENGASEEQRISFYKRQPSWDNSTIPTLLKSMDCSPPVNL